MKRIFLMVLFSVLVASVVQAQTVVVEIATTMTDGKWDSVNARPLSWVLETDVDGNAVVYTNEQVPDHNCLSTKDLQTWYVDMGGVWNRYTFSAKAEGLKGQYAIRVSLDGDVWTSWISKYLGKPRGPRSG